MAGYKESRGEYTFIGVDQDDFVAKDFLGRLWNTVSRTGADVVLCDWQTENNAGEFSSLLARNGIEYSREFTGRDAFELTFPWRIHAIGLWRKDLVERFAKDDNNAFNSYDSEEYLARLIMLNAKKVAISRATYYHCRNSNSITSGNSTKKLQSLDTNERLFHLAATQSAEQRVLWRIILYQRNYLANLLKMIYEMRRHGELSAELFKRHLSEIDKYLYKLFEGARSTSQGSLSMRLEAEKMIMKLKARRIIAGFQIPSR
ncbi:hypothetical protein ATO2_17540 [Roseovarius sp. 22II1-1F6A]|nr:hypothetical protein ATO2_17540 [Roseovarius sp. 22II1-1F6A]